MLNFTVLIKLADDINVYIINMEVPMKKTWKRCFFVIACIVVLIFAIWLWISRPVDVNSVIKNQEVIGMTIAHSLIKPGANGGTFSQTIYTQNSTEIKKVLDIMNQYPDNKNIFYSQLTDPSHYQDSDMMSILLEYKKPDGNKSVYTYQVFSDGHIENIGESIYFSSVGRFGDNKTKEYYNKIKEVFDLKNNNENWSKVESAKN